MESYTIVSPGDSTPYKTVPLSSPDEAINALKNSSNAFQSWRKTALEERIAIMERFLMSILSKKDDIAIELANLIGRPLKQNYNELRGLEERARYMMSVAPEALKDVECEPKEGFQRFIRKEPLGTVLVIAAWNYPYLIAVNGVVPALLAGNTVILKHAPQTFPCAERFSAAFKEAGLPDGVFQHLHISHPTTELLIKHPLLSHILFTGSVRGGREVSKAASDRFIGVGLELGGKDAAYVRQDADIPYAAENIVDGAMYNSGQSCCGIERVYVRQEVWDQFLEKVVQVVRGYKLGDPFAPETNLGPVIRTESAHVIREHVADAISKGAKPLIDESLFPSAKPGTPYVAPQVLINVDHSMRIMREETFGPVVGIMKVASDEEAVQLMNDSEFGLTASIWTKDVEKGLNFGEDLEVGTVFMNRCDYLDPAMAWTGWKDSGRGVTLSKFG
ncbi:hypothetical protein SpCBS45565_g07467 [Spizellomyces sp. 'palustris']|nr:hypothetical protein SpCBS45565_g07467 [Spizellomyces sp. 'palustris']